MYKKILVPLDGSKLAECVLPHLEELTKGGSVKEVVFVRVPELVFVPVIEGDDVAFHESEKEYKELQAKYNAEAKRYLDGIIASVNYPGVKVTADVLKEGKAAEEISRYASANGVELIVIATHGRSGVSKWVWGSVADRVLRSARVPVLMIRAPGCIPGF